jgi:hypothetical protein
VINRVGMPILVSTAQLGAAALALGRPDPVPALRFLGGGWPTAGDTLAALELLVWTIVLAAVGWSLATMGWDLASRVASSARFREGSALATGLLILVAGAAHHVTEPVGMSGGSVQEAQAFLGR